MRRRELIAGLGVAAAWPLAARAQPGRMRRIGVLMNSVDEDGRVNYAAFLQVLQQLGWTDGHNVRIDTRWAGGIASDIRKHAAELAALGARPDRGGDRAFVGA